MRGSLNGTTARKGAAHYLPILDWGRHYDRHALTNDLVAAIIVTIMLIPQSLAYAMLAGLPPQVGLYASILPIAAYAVFGTSRSLAVGPVAVVSLMTAAAVGNVAAQGTPEYIAAALALAFISGLMLLAMGFLRLGFLASFLSHPVISGFIVAAGLLIAAGQLRHVLGIRANGDTLPELALSLAAGIGDTNLATLGVGLASLAFLLWVRKGFKPLLRRIGLGPRLADLFARTGPILAVAAATGAFYGLDLARHGVAIVGEVPRALPELALPPLSIGLWTSLAGSALLISVIGFVESISVAQTLAARKRQRIDPDQELIALGASNVAAGVSGGYPVTGGFARSVVNHDAGAETPAAGAFTAIAIAAAALLLTPLIHFLPQATLAATIIVAVLSIIDLSVLKRSWTYSKADFAAVTATMAATLAIGIEAGISAGIALSVLIHLYRTTRPHMAVVGRVPGTEHYRNVLRHEVETDPAILSLRVDESLYFANARYLEDRVYDLVAARPEIRHVVLMCPAVNEIDLSALESLEVINDRLREIGVSFHLSEVKGPVMDRLRRSHFLNHLTGGVHLSQHRAVEAIRAELDGNQGEPASMPAE